MATPGQLQMYNKLEVMEMFSLDDRALDKFGNKKRIHVKQDEKVPDCTLFTVWLEDHTIGNLLRMELLRNDNVIFAGYKVPHPLDHMIEMRVQTLPRSSPELAMRRAIANLRHEYSSIFDQFDQGVADWKREQKKLYIQPQMEDAPMTDYSVGSSEDRERDPSAVGEDRRFQEQLHQLEQHHDRQTSDYSPTYAGSPLGPP
eukprot:TRINITY_DN57133_c0_g1_i1.p2 TRINITY_DN57133_c0_g1~~TRINITY_DN57133_c0_g1_i1.p2  ORF type:complete len:201 (+),score=46.07 TRINITY_DN57133_c0_g1_i1:153-755(+)